MAGLVPATQKRWPWGVRGGAAGLVLERRRFWIPGKRPGMTTPWGGSARPGLGVLLGERERAGHPLGVGAVEEGGLEEGAAEADAQEARELVAAQFEAVGPADAGSIALGRVMPV